MGVYLCVYVYLCECAGYEKACACAHAVGVRVYACYRACMGVIGLDISYRAVLAPAASVTLAIRSGFLSVPTVLSEGVPLDSLITNLFECSYQHPWVEALKLKWRFTTPFIRAAFLLGTGSSVGFNQWAGGLPSAKIHRGHHIINKSVAAMPYINRPVKRKSFLGRHLYHLLDADADPALPDISVKVDRPPSSCWTAESVTLNPPWLDLTARVVG